MISILTIAIAFVCAQMPPPTAPQTAPPAMPDPTDLLKQLNLNGQTPDPAAVGMLTMTDNGDMKATTDGSISQETLEVACAKAPPCATGFLCVPETDTDGTILPPAVADMDFATKLAAAEDKAKSIAAECGVRRDALFKSVVHTTVGASLALRVSLLLTAEAVAAQWRVFWLLARVNWIMAWTGLGGVAVNAPPTGDQKACNVVFTEEQCTLFANLKKLDDLRQMDKQAGKPERLLPLNETQLHAMLAEQVTVEEQTTISALDLPTAAGNPFTDATVDKPWLDFFVDLKKVNQAINDAKAADDKLDPSDRDPALIAAIVARNQLAKLSLYGAVLHAFNKQAQVYLDLDAGVQIAAVNSIPECANMLLPNQACKDARLTKLKETVVKLADSVSKAAQIIEVSKVRGAFVWKFVQLSGERSKALWGGVVKCVMFFAKHVVAIAKAKLVVAGQIAASASFQAKLDEIRTDWVALNVLVAKVALLPSKKADDLSAADKAALITLVLKIKNERDALWGDLGKAITAAKVARRVVCRRRLAQTVKFSLRAVCRKQDDDDACITRVQDYFNGIRQKLIDNKDTLKDAFAAYSDIKTCWPLIRVKITTRVVAGAFKAATSTMATADPTQVAMENVVNDPCASQQPDGTNAAPQCEETQGELVIPADCTSVPMTESGMPVIDGSVSQMLTVTNTNPMMRKRAVLADMEMATKFATVFGVDAKSGSSFAPSTTDASVNLMAKEYSVAVDASLKQVPSCADLGISASDPMCAMLPTPVVTSGSTGTNGPGTTGTGTSGPGATTNGSSSANSLVIASALSMFVIALFAVLL